MLAVLHPHKPQYQRMVGERGKEKKERRETIVSELSFSAPCYPGGFR